MTDLNRMLAQQQAAGTISRQLEALNLTLMETNKVLRRIESLQDERNGGIMQIVDAIKTHGGVDLDPLVDAINNIDLTT